MKQTSRPSRPKGNNDATRHDDAVPPCGKIDSPQPRLCRLRLPNAIAPFHRRAVKCAIRHFRDEFVWHITNPQEATAPGAVYMGEMVLG